MARSRIVFLTLWTVAAFLIQGCLLAKDAQKDEEGTDSDEKGTDSSRLDGPTDTGTDVDFADDGDTDTDIVSDTDTDTDTVASEYLDTEGDTETVVTIDGESDTVSDSDMDTESVNGDGEDSQGDTSEDSETGKMICEPDAVRACQNTAGNCAQGVETCLEDGSGFGPCSIHAEKDDSCEKGDDANCNGSPNEGCDCKNGETQECGVTNEGICKFGEATCSDGQWSNCEDAVLPGARDCNSSKDNDCNGTLDNEETTYCKCSAENSPRQCDPYEKKGVGICVMGEQACVLSDDKTTSDWGQCKGATAPREEVCDDAENDEDCDGTGNEGCACVAGETRNCGKDTGTCQTGKQSCVDGQWSETCVGEIKEGPRDCSSSDDNDCNGTADNAETAYCKCVPEETRACDPYQKNGVGICAVGFQVCESGSGGTLSDWSAVCENAVAPGVETCDADVLDEDCDGSSNEGCACVNGAVQTCGLDIGICKKGTNACVNGQWSVNCAGSIPPGTEICDAAHLDEDCDGQNNEGCVCVNDETRQCGSDVGVCHKGLETCVNGQWSDCEGEVSPKDEACDDGNLDEDCDGQVNEGCFLGGPCVTTEDNSEVLVLARGTDGMIHRRDVGVSSGQWQTTNLSGSTIDIAAELDCTASADGIHLVARGNNPIGALMYTSGTGTLFNNFTRMLSVHEFDAHPGIAVYQYASSASSVQFAAHNSHSIYALEIGDDDDDYIDVSTEGITSSLDVARESFQFYGDTFYAGFSSDGTLVVQRYRNATSSEWKPTVTLAAPSGKSFEFSPTICGEAIRSPVQHPHIIVVADGDLWYGGSLPLDAGGSVTWTKITTGIDFASAPDCAVTSGNEVHAAARRADGGIVLIEGTAGNFSTTDLGTY